MSSSKPTISVLIPVYNGADTLSDCLESLLQQVYPAHMYEIIVIENGSTDNTTAIAERYPVTVLHSAWRGPAAARNTGLSKSKGEIIAFTDSDCVAAPNWLSELIKPYEAAQVGGVGGAILAHDLPEQTNVYRFCQERSPLINFSSGQGEFLPHLYTANASYRRELLERVGGFDPRLLTAEDVDLSWRIQLQTGAQLCYTSQAIIYHRHRSTRRSLGRQYRQYGFGEIMLDTLYGSHAAYPRSVWYQIRRIQSQIAALPRYLVSRILSQMRLKMGHVTPYQASVPGLCFLVESHNVWGKLEGLIATRFMRDAQPALNARPEDLISRFYDRKGDPKQSPVGTNL